MMLFVDGPDRNPHGYRVCSFSRSLRVPIVVNGNPADRASLSPGLPVTCVACKVWPKY